tara:strand:- start:277 stop:693 length:417 start_codon:yes stop_codon:yes gene_type:complete
VGANFDPSSDEGINDINITPFVDVVLVLLVIFMVTAPMMVKESLNIKLPNANGADRSDPARLGIAINSNGQVLLNGELITVETLEVEASIALTENQEIQALISADKEAKHGDVIKVLDIIKKVGIDNFAFQIERLVKE